MIKRMTLLSRRKDTPVSDFRAYWSGCHAQLALCMDGITSYTQNRVDKCLWQLSNDAGQFDIDGIVELCFESDDVMGIAQRSRVGSEYLPDDELNFLHGWTLCVVTHEDEPKQHRGVKVVVAAAMADGVSRDDFRNGFIQANASQVIPAKISFNWTEMSAKRERLWAEPVAPDVLAALWFESNAHVQDAFRRDGEFARQLSRLSSRAGAYLINAHVVK